MPVIQIPNGWAPRDYQHPLWEFLESGGKRAVAVWHRRAGKDANCLNWTAAAMMQKPATYWHMLPKANQARKAIWDAVNPMTGRRLIDQAFPHEIRETTREQDMLIRLKNGATWQVLGSDNYNSLVGSPPYGVVFSEWSLCDPSAWDYIRPILAENGGWAFFIYTPRGKNHGWRLYDMARKSDKWFAQLLTAEETKAIPQEVLDEELAELISQKGEEEGRAIFEQEYHCSFDAAIPGAYYAAWMTAADKEGRIGRVPYEPTMPVHTCWDLGMGDSTAIWFFQVVNNEWRFIDFYENSGEGLQHYAKVLQEKRYVYGDHIAPHDIAVRELGTGKSRLEVAQNLGLNFVTAENLPIDDGIQAVRDILPLAWFDDEKCERGIDALRSYRREFNEKMNVFKDRPLHDWASHPADSIRYGAVGYRSRVGAGRINYRGMSIA